MLHWSLISSSCSEMISQVLSYTSFLHKLQAFIEPLETSKILIQTGLP